MAECIERAAAVKTVLRMRRPENSVAQNRMLSIIQMDLLKLPTADVTPVVRCKDCKWDRPDTLLDKHWCSRLLGCMEVRADDFCSYGERKDCGDADR